MKKNPMHIQRNIKNYSLLWFDPYRDNRGKDTGKHGVSVKSEFQRLFHQEFLMAIVDFEGPNISI